MRYRILARIHGLRQALIRYTAALTDRLGLVDPVLVDPWSFSGWIDGLDRDTAKAL